MSFIVGPLHRLRQRSALGPSRDGHHYAVVHCTGYIKNWPPSGVPMDRGADDDSHSGSHCCLVAIGRLQVTSTPNTSDLVGSTSTSGIVIDSNSFLTVLIFFFYQFFKKLLNFFFFFLHIFDEMQSLSLVIPRKESSLSWISEFSICSVIRHPSCWVKSVLNCSIRKMLVTWRRVSNKCWSWKVRWCRSCIDSDPNHAIGSGWEPRPLHSSILTLMRWNTLSAPTPPPSKFFFCFFNLNYRWGNYLELLTATFWPEYLNLDKFDLKKQYNWPLIQNLDNFLLKNLNILTLKNEIINLESKMLTISTQKLKHCDLENHLSQFWQI